MLTNLDAKDHWHRFVGPLDSGCGVEEEEFLTIQGMTNYRTKKPEGLSGSMLFIWAVRKSSQDFP